MEAIAPIALNVHPPGALTLNSKKKILSHNNNFI